MSFPYRSTSPILKVANKRKAGELLLEKGKIHRIRLISDAICELCNVVSPGCIWFKLKKSISSDLQCVKPNPLKPFVPSADPNDDLYKYAMAPIQEDVYARVRIVHIKSINENNFAYVHFIDEGYAEWVNMRCLAQMEEKLFTHPWQAFPVALFKSMPGVDLLSLSENSAWDEKSTRILANILSDYEYFRVKPIPSSDRQNSNNYYEYPRADVFGLVSDTDLVGESITHRMTMEIFSIQGKVERIDIIHRSWYDAKQQTLIRSSEEEIPIQSDLIQSMPNWRRDFPEDFCPPELMALSTEDVTEKKEEENGENEEDEGEETKIKKIPLQPYAEWDPDCPPDAYPKIPSITLSYLAKNGYCDENEELYVCVQWESLKTPHEFYAFPMLRNVDDPLGEFHTERLKWAETLDSFYGHYTNRRTVDSQIIMRMLRDASNPQVFAIYEYNDERTTGSYRRVEVLAVRDINALDYSDEFCRIRFLDLGGSNIVPLASLLAIHSQHCKRPPMSIQLNLGRIVPSDGAFNWSEKFCSMFRKLARTDMPMGCKYLRQVPSNIRNAYNDPPQTWPDVFEVANLRIDDLEKSVEEEMIEKKCAKKSDLAH